MTSVRRSWAPLGLALLAFALASVPAADGEAAPDDHGSLPALEARTPVVVELFTSEGCSSCPAADAVLTRLSRAQSIAGARIVPLALHVDYWDDLGWKDPFASAQFTTRQRRFSGAKGEGRVYTPEAVVDGDASLVGSDESALRRAIEGAAKRPHVVVAVTRNGATADQLEVRVAGTTSTDEVDALLAITEDDLLVQVPRGENGGRRLEHSGVVRELRALGAVPKTGATFAPRLNALPSVLAPVTALGKRRHAVVIVEERRSRRILGAGVLDL